MPPDPILDRQLQAMAFLLGGLLLVALAIYLRLKIFIGTRPGGVDTWYYLASANALRTRKRLPISLPQYLLHERSESYPAVFPIVLAFLPQGWLQRYFWLVSPLLDSLHLLLLYLLSYRLTDSVLAAVSAGLIYAVAPTLISESRNLNGRAFASLLQTFAMIMLMRSMIPSTGPTRMLLGESDLIPSVLALLLISLLYNTHTSTTIAFVVSTAVLSAVTGESRFLVFGLAGLPLAIVLSGGYYLRVIRNHLHAARFWIRNLGLTRAHQIEDSPILRDGNAAVRESTRIYRGGWRALGDLIFRLLGENPFILAMLVTPVPQATWGANMYWWAVAILGWAVATTLIPPLRIFGPGFQYMKLSVFPTAYALAVTVDLREGALTLFALVLLVSFLGSFGALAYFYRYMARRRTEHTAQTPPDLAEATQHLKSLPGKNVLVLPSMYADFVSFNASKAVVWGGHSGNLDQFHEFFPVLRHPLPYFFERYQVDYLMLDVAYVTPERLHVEAEVDLLKAFGSIGLYRVRAAERAESAGMSLSSSASARTG